MFPWLLQRRGLAGHRWCRPDSHLRPRSLRPPLEKGLSLLSYKLCNYSVTQHVQRVEAVQVSHVTYAPCGGWIPWRRCPKTVYRTRYLAVDVPEPRNVTGCCEGYEQLGLYCVLRECAARPGRSPVSCSWGPGSLPVARAHTPNFPDAPRTLAGPWELR